MKNSVLTLTLASTLAFMIGSAHAESIGSLGDLPGGFTDASANAINPNGTVIIGTSNGTNGAEAYRWTSGTGMVGIGDLTGGIFSSSANAVSADGTIIVGGGTSASGAEAYRWTSGTGMVGLGDLAGGTFSSLAIGVSADGTTIVGRSNSTNGTEAFRWTSGTGMVGLGDLAGGGFLSIANSVSGDGSIIVGSSTSANGQEAFRWTSGTGMVGLGDIAGGLFSSFASDISADGLVIVGGGTNASNNTSAYRWTSGTGMVALVDLAGGANNSAANATNSDGSVIVGYGTDATGTVAMRWTQATGMQSIPDLLIAAGVDLTGWQITSAKDVDDTGNLIIGSGSLNGTGVAYLVNLNSMGVTTPADLIDGLASSIIPVQQSQSAMNANIGQSLFAARQSLSALSERRDMSEPANFAPAAGDTLLSRKWSGYMVGSFAAGQDNDFDNNAINGTMGLLIEFDRNLVVGAGIIGTHGRADRQYSGDSSLDSKGGSVIAAYETDAGLRLYGTAFAADLKIDSKRGYLNGSGLDASYADIDGIGFGVALRGGYEFAIATNTNLMPYVEVQASRTKLDSYTETGGGFPASFSGTTNDQVTSYLGTEISYDINSSLTIGGRAAWAHRLKEDGDGITASTTGFTGNLGLESGDRNWAEGALSTNWRITEDTRLGAELSGRSGKTQDPAATLTLGLQHKF